MSKRLLTAICSIDIRSVATMKKGSGRGAWTAAEDQLAFFTFGILPFSEVRAGLKLLPNRTPAEVYERFLVIMSNTALQERLLKESRGHLVPSHTVKWQPQELFAAVQVLANDVETDLTNVLSSYPHLFHPTRTPDGVARMCSRLGARESSTISQSQNRYIEFAEGLHQRVRGCEPWVIEKPDLEELTNGTYRIERKRPPAPPAREHPPIVIRDEARVNCVRVADQFPIQLPKRIPKPKKIDKGVDIVAAIRKKAVARLKPKTLAGLIGRRGLIEMEKATVTLGRATPLTHPDIDLSGYCMQSIARIHCEVSLRSDLEFYLKVFARDVLVDGQLFKTGDIVRLRDGCMVDVGVPFIFVENPVMMEKLRETQSE